MHDELETAVAAARAAGEILRAGFGHAHELTVKGVIDFATEVDIAAERRIVQILQAATPGYGFLTEERTAAPGQAGVRWIVDPLDGTTNYAHGYPQFCVSVGLERDGELQVGAIYNPLRDELFTARRGCGAFLNGRPIHVSNVTSLGHAFLTTGYGYEVWTDDDDNLAETRYFVKHTAGVRCFGSAALDLAAVACGRSDGHWENGLKPYDLAAGALLVREAGGQVTDYRGSHDVVNGYGLVAANRGLHAEVLAALRLVRG